MTGGLGNQMFIYAMHLAMKHRFPNTRIDLSDMMHYHVHNGYELHRIFPHLPQDEFCVWRPLKKVMEALCFRIILERHQNMETLEAYRCRYLWPWVYFKGFYQDERYFREIEDEVREAFRFDTGMLNADSGAWLQKIEECPHSVSVHIRRGDYLQAGTWQMLGQVCTVDYFQRAVDTLIEDYGDAEFFIFSDDMDWVREHLSIPRAHYVDCNRGNDSWQDMMLMSRCCHNIISNSTFSWWGAWLNAHQDKRVLCPNHWCAGDENPRIIPAAWEKIDTTP